MIDLPHYTLEQKCFEGSGTTVYRGRRDADGAPVAIKVTRSEYPTARGSPPGQRLGVDRDGDGFRDGNEIDAGTDPADAANHP